MRHGCKFLDNKLPEESMEGDYIKTDWILNHKCFKNININDIIQTVVDSKERVHFAEYEDSVINYNLIRAGHGHSSVKRKMIDEMPPEFLYHGTPLNIYNNFIKLSGLHPMGRQFVHLDEGITRATKVAKRHNKDIIILKINAIEAYNNGIKFYKSEDGVWLSYSIPPEYISDNSS